MADSQFDCIENNLKEMQPAVNYSQLSSEEHESFIERNNRFVKERCRCMFAELPFNRIPKRMIIRLVYTAIFWINSFPRNEGISDTMSPRLMLTGIKPSMLHARYQFGDYFQVHEKSTNSMKERTTDAIFTGPIGNIQGGFYAMSLTTGQQLKRFKATVLPTPESVIARVHELADKDKSERGLTFENSERGITINDLETDENNEDDDASDGDYSSTSTLDDVSLRADSDIEDEAGEQLDTNANETDPSAIENYYEPLSSTEKEDEEGEPDGQEEARNGQDDQDAQPDMVTVTDSTHNEEKDMSKIPTIRTNHQHVSIPPW